MITAYKKAQLQALEKLNLAKKLQKEGFIKKDVLLDELAADAQFFHPNWPMRILLFIVGYIAFSGLIGLWFLLANNGIGNHWEIFSFVSGVLGLVAFEGFVVRTIRHYKSGLSEAILYLSLSLIVGSFVQLIDRETALGLFIGFVLLAAAAIRYVDRTLTALAVGCFAGAIFFLLEGAGGVLKAVVPFVFMALFSAIYFLVKRFSSHESLAIWKTQMHVIEAICLVIIYAAGNYFVVQKLSVDMMYMNVEQPSDIPLAWVFYSLTVLLPAVFLYFGVKNRDRILLWLGLLSAGFSVFTFKYYFSLGHPEITLTISGLLVLGLAVFLLNKLKSPINGITREKLGVENLDALSAEGVFISQTMGGIVAKNQPEDVFGGGNFGGGGASGNVD